MAKKWSDVAASSAFQALSFDEQEEARRQYFEAIIAPQVPEADVGFALEQFLSDTRGGGLGRGSINPPLASEPQPQMPAVEVPEQRPSFLPESQEQGLPESVRKFNKAARLKAKAEDTPSSFADEAKDFGLSFLQGTMDVASLPVTLYEQVSGSKDSAIRRFFRTGQEAAEGLKSDKAKAKREATAAAIDAAENWQEALAVGIVEGFSDPSATVQTLARMVPQIAAGGGAGRLVEAGVTGLTNAARALPVAAAMTGRAGGVAEAAASTVGAVQSAASKVAASPVGRFIPSSATTGAVGSAAIMQGDSVGEEVYKALTQTPVATEQWAASDPGFAPVYEKLLETPVEKVRNDPFFIQQLESQAELSNLAPDAEEAAKAAWAANEAKRIRAADIANSVARKAAGISIFTNALPGGSAIETSLLRGPAAQQASRGMLERVALAATREGLISEPLEEGGGAYVGAQGKRQGGLIADPMMEAAAAAGQAVAPSMIAGGGAAAISRPSIPGRAQQPGSLGRVEPTLGDTAPGAPGGRVEPTMSFTPAGSPTQQAGLVDIVVPLPGAANDPILGDVNVGTSGTPGGLAGAGGIGGGGLVGGGMGVPGPGLDGAAGGGGGIAGVPAPDDGSLGAAGGAAQQSPSRLNRPFDRATDADLLARAEQAAGLPPAPATAGTPAKIWAGRAGDGYTQPQDAQQALPGLQRKYPDLTWNLQQNADGKYVWAGTTRGDASGTAVTGAAGQGLAGQPGAGVAQQPGAAGAGVVGVGQAVGGQPGQPGGAATVGGTAANEPAFTLKLAPSAPLRAVGQAITMLKSQRGVDVEIQAGNLTDQQKVASAMARLVGKTVTYLNHVGGKQEDMPNGFVISGQDKNIYLDSRSEDGALFVMMHEGVHALPQPIREKLVTTIKGLTKTEMRGDFAQKFGYDINNETEVDNEIAAFMTQAVTKRQDFWQELRTKMGDGDFAEVAKVILDKLNTFITGAKSQYGDEFLQRYATDAVAVRDAVSTAYADAMKAQGKPVPTDVTGQAVTASNRSRIGLDFKDVIKRTPELQAAAEKVKAGEMTAAEYDQLVNEAKPVEPYKTVPPPATESAIRTALTSDKVDRIGVPSRTLKAGDPVGLRLDIPAYSNHGTWVVSVHEQEAGYNAGKSIGYEPVAAATNVTFGVVEKAAMNIAAGKPKATIAVIKGGWKPTTPAEAKVKADQALKSKDWVQVGMDPERHSYFYDRATMAPVTAADEVIQIGPLVLAKNPTYGKKSDFMFSNRGQEPEIGARLRERIEGDYEGAAREYASLKGTKGGRVLDSDIARELSPEYRADRSRAPEVHEAVSDFVQRTFEARMAQPGEGEIVAFMAGGGGAGKSSAETLLAPILDKASTVLDGTLSSYDKAERNIQMALDSGRKVAIAYVYREPVDALVNGVLKRAMRTGRAVPVDALVKGHAGSSAVVRKLQEKFGNNPNFDLNVVDNSRGADKAVITDIDSITPVIVEGLKERFINATEQQFQAGQIDEKLYRATIGQQADAGAEAQGRAGVDSVQEGLEVGAQQGRGSEQPRDQVSQRDGDVSFEGNPDVLPPQQLTAGGIQFSLRRIEDIDDAPEITLQDLVGETVFPVLADLTAAGYTYMGKELRGGPYYTLLPSNSKQGLIWANDGKGVSSIKNKKAKRGVIGLIIAMKQDSHATNNTVANLIFRAVEDEIQKGSVRKEDIPKLDEMVRGLANRMATNPKTKEKSAIFPKFAEFPGFSDRAASEKFLREMPFEARGLFFEEMIKGPVQDMGLGAVRKVINDTIEPDLRGLNMGDAIMAIRFDPNEEPVVLGEKSGTPEHDSYRYAVKGKVIGKFTRPISFQNIFVDLMAERAEKGSNVTRDYRSLTLRKPEQVITQEIADKISSEPYKSFTSPAEAQAATAAANLDWTKIDRPAAAGVREFLRTRRVFGDSGVPSFDDAKKLIKDGKLRIFRLAETENWFSLEDRDGDRVMTSIMVMQPGVRQETLFGDMIEVAKANGATHIEIGKTVAPLKKVDAPRRVAPVMRELAAMTDNDLVNLGIDPVEVRRVNEVIKTEDAVQASPTSVIVASNRLSPADKIKWREVTTVKKEIGLDQLPSHIVPFADFMQTMATKASNGGLTARDVIKAYTIARSSMNRGAVATEKVKAAGLTLPRTFVDAKIRPEGAFGYWLLSPTGQGYLNAAEVGLTDQAAIDNAVKVMAPFGTQNTLGEDLKRAASGDLHTRLPGLAAAIKKAATGQDAVKDWQDALDNLYGVREAKKGFLGSLLGFGQLPTFDARQINVNVERESKEDTLRALSSTKAREVVATLAKRMDALSLTMDRKYEPFYRHLAHHAVWDAVGGTTTTHEDVVESMLTASNRARPIESDAEVVKLFSDLDSSRGLGRVRALEAVDAHPMGATIRQIDADFLDILQELDDAGLVKINCK